MSGKNEQPERTIMEIKKEDYPTLDKFTADNKILFDLEGLRCLNEYGGFDLQHPDYFNSWWPIVCIFLEEEPTFAKKPIIIDNESVFDFRRLKEYISPIVKEGRYIIRCLGEVPHKDGPDTSGIVFVFGYLSGEKQLNFYIYNSETDNYYVYETKFPEIFKNLM